MKKYLFFLTLVNILYFSEAQTFCPPPYELVASYPFNGNILDVSGYNRNGTIVGSGISLTTDRFGNPNSAYDFGPSLGEGIVFPLNIRSVIGISLWFNAKGSNTATYPTFFILDDDFALNTAPISSGYFYSCLIKETGNDDFFARVRNIGDDFSPIPDLIQKDIWHHYYLEFDGLNHRLKFYLDGSLVASKSTSSNIVLNNNYLRLGRQTTDLGNIDKFQGQMDDINIYNRTLSDCEIAKLYNCNNICSENSNCLETPSTIYGNNISCINQQLNYSVTGISGIDYIWSVPGLGSLGNGNSVSFNWGNAGFKKLYVIPSSTCVGIGMLNVTVACCEIIDSNFTVSYTSPLMSDCIATLSITSTLPKNRYLWSNGETKPIISIKESGTYTVKTYNTCKSQIDTIKVTINKTADRIPNIITPNHDLVNDVFSYEGCFTAGVDFTFFVYNRWGTEVYESKSYKLDWDAEGLSDGIYYYSLTDNESRKVIKGVLQVLR